MEFDIKVSLIANNAVTDLTLDEILLDSLSKSYKSFLTPSTIKITIWKSMPNHDETLVKLLDKFSGTN